MASVLGLAGKDVKTFPSLKDIPGNIDYYAKGMIAVSGVPNVFLTDTSFHRRVYQYLVPLLESIQSLSLLQSLLRMAEHTCTQDMIRNNITLREQALNEKREEIDELIANKEEDNTKRIEQLETEFEELSESIVDNTARAISVILGYGYTSVQKGMFLFNEKGEIIGYKPYYRERMMVCHNAIQRGEHIEAIDAGSGRRKHRKTVRRKNRNKLRKQQKKTRKH
jgi:hypothetical protein